MTLVADSKAYELIPVKKEVKAVVSGIYIMDVKGIRGPLEAPPKKLKFWARQKARFSRKTRNKEETRVLLIEAAPSFCSSQEGTGTAVSFPECSPQRSLSPGRCRSVRRSMAASLRRSSLAVPWLPSRICTPGPITF